MFSAAVYRPTAWCGEHIGFEPPCGCFRGSKTARMFVCTLWLFKHSHGIDGPFIYRWFTWVYLSEMVIFHGYVSHNQRVHIMFRFCRLSPVTGDIIFDGLKQRQNSQLASHPGVHPGAWGCLKVGNTKSAHGLWLERHKQLIKGLIIPGCYHLLSNW